jgi:hypothetical protein
MNDPIITGNDNQLVSLTPRPVGRELSTAVEKFANYASSYAVSSFEEFSSSGRLAQLALDVEHASRPATSDEIINHLTILVCAYPTGSSDLEIYGRVLGEDVIATKPSLFALEHACRKLRRTSKWRPAIAEVLGEIEEAEGILHKAKRELRELPSRLARYKEEQRRQEEQRRNHIAREIAWCVETLAYIEREGLDDFEFRGMDRAAIERWLYKLRESAASLNPPLLEAPRAVEPDDEGLAF